MKSDLADRILDAFPSGSYSLTALLRLLDIVETDAVPTAAVECRVQPRLLINPAFVAAHAETPAKLLMLVMHELHHVLLGHTTLFPRATWVQNFVFDAVINGVISRMFPHAEHLALFADLYPEDAFPACLLAPPPGWPGTVVRPAAGLRHLPPRLRRRAQEVHTALYSASGASYLEVYELLPKLLQASGKPASTRGQGKPSKAHVPPPDLPLLGDHGADELQTAGLERRSPVLFDVVRSIVEQWPQPPDPIRGRSLAEVLRESAVRCRPQSSNRGRLCALIRKVAGADGRGRIRRLRIDRAEAPTPIPSLARRSLVLQALGQRPLLHPGAVDWRRRVAVGQRVHVYLDVSGSMSQVLKALYGAIADCRELVDPTVHLFSTVVADITLAELRAGKCVSTGGTDIRCVAEHMRRQRITRALLVTDGFVGTPRGEHRETLAKAHLAVAFLGDALSQTDLQSVARHTCILDPRTAA